MFSHTTFLLINLFVVFLLTERVFKPTFLPALLSVRPCAGLLIPENLLAQSVPDHTEQLRGCVHASAGMRRLYLLGELLPPEDR